ncbi:MAG: helix-turn-helix domain-containing protein, partial [Enterococcus sp.]
IMENIGFFHQVGAEITTTITEADILLTDSRDLGSLYKKECIVWLAPPRPLDWANLGQKIIQKRADTERETQD